ncbi:MAG: hypothetical protein RL322_2104 [Pseudomonadota bacterium]|jgi:acyl-CoA synthetase
MINTMLTTLSYPDIRRFYAEGHWADDTLYDLVLKGAASHPDHVALQDSRRTVTYRQLLVAVNELADDLDRNGVRTGQRVAVWLSSRLETVVAILACSRNGLICSPSLHRNHTAEETLQLMSRMSAAALIGEAGYGANIEQTDIYDRLDSVPSLKCAYRLSAPDALDALAIHDLSGRDVLSGASAQTVPTEVGRRCGDANAVCYLAFTSGTTGEPKGVMHSSNTLLANARAMATDWSFDRESVVYTLSPLSHNLGFGAMVLALAVGARLVVHDLGRGKSLLQRLIEVGATFAFGVPVHASDLLKELEQAGEAKGLRLVGFRISGAAAPRALVKSLLGYGIRPQSGYGMTEGCSHHYTLPDDSPDRVINTSGRACPGYEVRIVSQDDPERVLPAGEVGQIVARGASLMLGYFDDQLSTERSYSPSGWFMTGDLGFLDAEGYITITGRKKDIIIRGGHNIFPARIESLAHQYPGLERVAAIPVPDERLGEKVCLVVMARSQKPIDANEVLAHLYHAGLSKFDMPEYFLQVDEIPLTASGKILKRAVVDAVNAGRWSPIPVRWSGPQP